MASTPTKSNSDNGRIADRREYYRMPAAHAGASRVELHLKTPEDRRCRARLVNVSAGGLLCKLAYTGPLPALNESVPMVHLYRHHHDPLSFAGTVRRLEINTSGMFCAVEFSALLPAVSTPVEERSQPPSESLRYPVENRIAPAFTIDPENFVGRLYTVPPLKQEDDHAGTNDGSELSRRRGLVSSAFRDIVQNLSQVEHWWFFHIVAMLKETEPEYPAELLAEYLRLCRKSVETQRQEVSA